MLLHVKGTKRVYTSYNTRIKHTCTLICWKSKHENAETAMLFKVKVRYTLMPNIEHLGQQNSYRRSGNFRVKKLSYDKFSCKKMFVGTTPYRISINSAH